MSDRGQSSGHSSASGAVPSRHRVLAGRGSGMPRYRPVRSPLVSMGPSLVEERRRHRSARNAAIASVALAVMLAVLVWAVTLLGREVVSGDSQGVAGGPLPVLPAGRPVPQKLAAVVLEDEDEPPLTIDLPIKREAVTGIGYLKRRDAAAMDLDPEGSRANTSWGRRVFGRFLETGPRGDLSWYQLTDGVPNVVIVGAAPGTDLYAPLDGTVVAIADHVVDGEQHGDVVQLQPLGDGETVVSMRLIDVQPQLAVGQKVSRGATLIGHVRAAHDAVPGPLGDYTHDEGSGVEITLRLADAPASS